jgi:hypothetical protein
MPLAYVDRLAGGAKTILEDPRCALYVSTSLNNGHCCVERTWFPQDCITWGHDKQLREHDFPPGCSRAHYNQRGQITRLMHCAKGRC